MKAEKNKVVSLTYELIVDGVLADKADENRPLEYLHGNGMLLPKFESEVEGLEPGEEFAFTLTPEEGYGVFDESRLIDLPKEAFMIDGKVREDLLVVGKMIPMMSDAGQVVNGIVYEVTDEKVTMDFNHPMAGKTLNFTGKVVEVREETLLIELADKMPPVEILKNAVADVLDENKTDIIESAKIKV